MVLLQIENLATLLQSKPFTSSCKQQRNGASKVKLKTVQKDRRHTPRAGHTRKSFHLFFFCAAFQGGVGPGDTRGKREAHCNNLLSLNTRCNMFYSCCCRCCFCAVQFGRLQFSWGTRHTKAFRLERTICYQ